MCETKKCEVAPVTQNISFKHTRITIEPGGGDCGGNFNMNCGNNNCDPCSLGTSFAGGGSGTNIINNVNGNGNIINNVVGQGGGSCGHNGCGGCDSGFGGGPRGGFGGGPRGGFGGGPRGVIDKMIQKLMSMLGLNC